MSVDNVKDNLATSQDKSKKSYSEWATEMYNSQYESWMPWIEDQYLKWFGKGDNKASYATKGTYPITTNTPSIKIRSGGIQFNTHELC